MSKLKYCPFCRGDDNPMIRCVDCKYPFHFECLSLREIDFASSSKRADFKCHDCKESLTRDGNVTLTTERNKNPDEVLFKKKLKLNKGWTNKIVTKRNEFIANNREYFQKFCTVETLDRISSKGINSSETAVASTEAEILALSQLVYLPNSPTFIQNATLRDYQLEGVTRIGSWFLRGVGGILADEMGLGKTIQTIAFISNLKNCLGLTGPHLIVTPLAVLQNWSNEFSRFAPDISYKKIYGSQSERKQILTDANVLEGKFDVYLTTYETLLNEEHFFSDSWPWLTLTIDEGHRIKNENAKLRFALNRVRCPFRLLLTGTPLQNNLHELWALLNYILPEIFSSSLIFDEGVHISGDTINTNTCGAARSLLEHHMMLRRMKSDVEKKLLPKIQCKISIPLTKLQLKWYDIVLNAEEACTSMMTSGQMLHLLSQLRKVVNHPKQIYLKRLELREKERKRVETLESSGAEFFKPDPNLQPPPVGSEAWAVENELRILTGESLIKSCGKLRMLDRLLLRLRSQGSRCLVFSQFVETLDIIEEYVKYRFGAANVVYLRLDGSTNRIIREMNTRAFNHPDSTIFMYLISTAAGGMGINLATADSVILYDSAWNPQVDLQAQDRAHRIGQKKQVTVYRLITADTFEERILQMAERKLLLDHVVIAKSHGAKESDLADGDVNVSMSELRSLLNYDAMGKASVSADMAGASDMLMDWEIDTRIDSCMGSATVIKSLSSSSSSSASAPVMPVAVTGNVDGNELVRRDIDKTSEKIVPLESINSSSSSLGNVDTPQQNALISQASYASSSTCSLSQSQSSTSASFHMAQTHGDTNQQESRKIKCPNRFMPAPIPSVVRAGKKKRVRSSEDVCFCCNDGGFLLECGTCPKAYHLECLGMKKVPNGQWHCPWHTCITCDRTSSNSGGMQFRCLSCPVTYCFDCFPTHMEMVQTNPPAEFIRNYQSRGYDIPKTSIFTFCEECRTDEAKVNLYSQKSPKPKTSPHIPSSASQVV